MNDNKELLKILIENSKFPPQMKVNKIIQALQRTEDSLRAKVLSEQIMDGNLDGLSEESINNIIKAFDETGVNAVSKSTIIEKENYTEESFSTNKEETLKYELGAKESQIKQLEKAFNEQLKEEKERNKKLQEERDIEIERNKKLISILSATSMFELIEVSDEDINELYIKYLQNGQTKHNSALIIDDIIPKAYYKINKSGGHEKC